jgi:AdoMet-dependent heme synthase
MNKTFDLERAPLLAVWETTQTCDPEYCLETGQPERDPLELTTAEAERMIREVAELRPPVFVMAGGSPLERKDIYGMVRYASACGLHPTMILNGRSQLARDVIKELKSSSLSRLGLVIDGSSAEIHDNINGKGSFARTVQAIHWANEARLPVQIHTYLARRNVTELEGIAALLSTHRVLLWSVSFPVAAADLTSHDMLTAQETEEVFVRLYRLAHLVDFKVKTVEAPHYRRFVLQQRAKARGETDTDGFFENGVPGVMPVVETRGTLFITNTGEVYPSGRLPVSAGNIRTQKLTEIYRESELFKGIRDVSKLHGKCGRCNFKELCGGSRARALALAGDMFTEDGSCIYEPSAVLRTAEQASVEGSQLADL